MAGPTVLVVDAGDEHRRAVRRSLESDGAEVLEASSLEQARRLLAASSDDGWRGIVVGRALPDGDGLDLLADLGARRLDVPVVVLAGGPGPQGPGPANVVTVARDDAARLADVLSLPHGPSATRRLVASGLVASEANAIAADWRELCRWDPMLAADSSPPIATAFVRAVGEALSRPQPLGWGPDPQVEKVAEVFAMTVGVIDAAVGQLVCLREAVSRALKGRVPPEEAEETAARLQMVVDRAIGVVAQRTAARLEKEAYLDALTGLLNRGALQRNLRRELGRAERYGRRLTVVMADLVGLKAVNDTEGHAAGDDRLRAMARSLTGGLRIGDTAYRTGGDEFVVVLPETDAAGTPASMERVARSAAPPFSWGSATYPDDGDDPTVLLDLADRRLFAQRRQERAGEVAAEPA